MVDVAATGTVATDTTDFYRITGADYIELRSRTGDADLRVFNVPNDSESEINSLLVCESDNGGESDIDYDYCDELIAGSTYYVQVLNSADASYMLTASPPYIYPD